MKRDSKRVTSRNKEVATIKSLKIIQHYDLPSLLEAIDKHLEENGYNQQENDKAVKNEVNTQADSQPNESIQADSQPKESIQADSQPKESHDDEAKIRERIIQRMKKQNAKTSVETQRGGNCKDVTNKQAKSKRIVPKKTTKDHTKLTANANQEGGGKGKKKNKKMKPERVIKRNVSDKTHAPELTVDLHEKCGDVDEKQVDRERSSVDDDNSLESLIDGMRRLTIHDPDVPISEVAKVPQALEPEVASKNRKRKLELHDVIGAQLKKLRNLVENEEKLYDSVVDGLSSYTIKEPVERSVQDSSPSKKCKIEVVPVKKPVTERLNEEPVKRKCIISHRHIKKTSVKTATSVSAPIRACAPHKDLRKVLQGRQGLCY